MNRLLTLLIVFLLMTPHQAGAEPAVDLVRSQSPDPLAARRSFERGRAHYEAGEYGAAARVFAQAYVAGGPAKLLFNLAQAHRRAGDCALAHRYYARFLEEAPDAGNRSVARKHLRALATCATTPVPAPESRPPSRPGQPVPAASPPAASAKPPAPAASPTAPAASRPPASASPRAATAKPPAPVRLAPALGVAVSTEVETSPPPKANQPATASSVAAVAEPGGPRSMALRNVGVAIAGVGLAVALTGVLLDAPACPLDGCDDDDDETTDVRPALMLGGGITAIAGAGLAIWGHRRGRATSVALVPTRGGGVVARVWRF